VRFSPAGFKAVTLLALLAWALAMIPPAASGRSDKEVDQLIINSSAKFRTTARLSEAEGIAQLLALIPGADYEEIWAYLPVLERWVELGCCERQTQRGNYVDLDGHVLTLMAAHPFLAIYHIHTPTHFIRENNHQNRRLLKQAEESVATLVNLALKRLAKDPFVLKFDPLR